MNFLQSKILFQTKYEESRETIETKREVNFIFDEKTNLLVFLISYVLMNIDCIKDALYGVHVYLQYVKIIVIQRWIVNRIKVLFLNKDRNLTFIIIFRTICLY